jgi:hypothetical protein
VINVHSCYKGEEIVADAAFAAVFAWTPLAYRAAASHIKGHC